MPNTIQLSSNSDQSYHWYVIHTDNQQYLKRVLTGRKGIEEVYLPMEHIKCKDTAKLRAKVLLTTYIFVYAIESSIRSELEVFDAQLELDSRRNYLRPMVITDADMDTFKTMCEHHLDIERLRNPYATFFKNDRARIMVGPFVGFEGFIKEIKGDLKLITQLGDWTVAISNIQKYDIEIISNKSSHSTEAARFARLADYFREILLGHDVQDTFRCEGEKRVRIFDNEAKTRLTINVASDMVEATRLLRQLISGMHRHSTKKQFLKALTHKSVINSHDTKVMRDFLSTMSYNDEAMLNQMTQYIYSKDSKAVLEEPIPDITFRPFLTITPGAEMTAAPKIKSQSNVISDENSKPETSCIVNPIPTIVSHPSMNCDEWIYEINMTEGEYDAATGKTEIKSIPYYAHVAVMPYGTDKIQLMTNWGDFFKKYQLWQKDEQSNFLLKLRKYNLMTFHNLLFGITPYSVMTSPIGTGIGIIIDKHENIETAIKSLIETNISLIEEILSSTRLRPWQKRLSSVWIRR